MTFGAIDLDLRDCSLVRNNTFGVRRVVFRLLPLVSQPTKIASAAPACFLEAVAKNESKSVFFRLSDVISVRSEFLRQNRLLNQ